MVSPTSIFGEPRDGLKSTAITTISSIDGGEDSPSQRKDKNLSGPELSKAGSIFSFDLVPEAHIWWVWRTSKDE